MVLSLLTNLGLLSLAALTVFLFFSKVQTAPTSKKGSVFVGIVYGLASILVVSVPIEGPLGSSFDTRAAPILIVTYFSGPLSGAIAATMGAVARFEVGGPAVLGGMASFYLYLFAALLFRAITRQRDPSVFGFVGLATLASVCVIPAFFIGQPMQAGLEILRSFGHVLFIGNLIGTVLLGLVVTQMRGLLSKEHEHDAILRSSPDGIVTVDQARRIRSMNPSALSMFGWGEEAVIGQDISLLVPAHAHAQHDAFADSFIQDAHANFREMTGYRIVDALKHDGTVFPVLISLSKIYLSRDPIIVATVHDMTEVRDARRNLEKMSETLARQLRESTDANDAKNRFLANMSHELRTPLNAIIGYTGLIEAIGVKNLSDEKLLEYIADIQTGGEALLKMINDVIDISKIERNDGALDIATHSLSEITDPTVRLLDVLAAKRDITVGVAKGGASIRVECDIQLTRQAFLNILSNAIKFSPTGSEITVRSYREGDQVFLCVDDRGPGFSDEILNRLGEPFLRSDDPFIRGTEGTGLGLAITMRFLERQNGQLDIANREQGGASATISLPAARVRPAPS